jgi:hypothetical protein
MRESSERQLQAYVLPDKVGIFDGTTVVPAQPARANVPGVGMAIKNFGQTPAFRVVSWAQITVMAMAQENTMPVVPPIPPQFSTTIGPSAVIQKAVWFDRQLTAQEIADIGTGLRAVYLYGRIEYQDVFKKARHTNFRLRYSGPYPPAQGAIFNFSESGNDAE